MNKELYNNLLDESPYIYIYIEGIKCDNNYTDIKIIRMNESAINFMDLYKNEVDKNYIKNLLLSNDNLDNNLRKIEKNKKITFRKYINNKSICITIDIYHEQNELFLVRITGFEKDLNKLLKVLENAPFSAWIKDLDGNYIYENRLHKIANKQANESLLGKNDFDLFENITYVDNIVKQDKRVLEVDDVMMFEDNFKDNNGESIYLQKTKWPYKDDQQNIVGIVGIALDITQNVKLKTKIRENSTMLLEVANNIEDVLMIKNEEKAIYVSPSFKKMFGYNPVDLYKNINNWSNYVKSIEYIDGPSDFNFDGVSTDIIKILNNHDEYKWFRLKFSPIYDENNNVTKRIGTITDITESRKSQENIENIRLEFFANISHELRTPINLILSSIAVLKLRIDSLDQDNKSYFDKYIKILNQNGLRLLKLVNNLIDITKLNSSNFEFTPTNQNIVNFVEDICLSIVDFVEQNNLSITFDTDVEEKIIGFDLNGMERIILNLLSNAIKFNKDNGQILVNISTKDNIEISITDNGIGIPDEKKDSIFTRFEQVNCDNRTPNKGSGIGLSLVKSIVDMHNGEIKVESILGEKSTFTVVLPNKMIETDSLGLINSYSDDNIFSIEFSDIYMN